MEFQIRRDAFGRFVGVAVDKGGKVIMRTRSWAAKSGVEADLREIRAPFEADAAPA